jgi:ATP-binding cassette, subfamily G (WHITE), member 2, PDR
MFQPIAENNHSRNFGIIVALMIFFTFTYLAASEIVTAKKPKGEVLLFRRGYGPTSKTTNDLESSSQSLKPTEVLVEKTSPKLSGTIQKQTSIFQWKNICYDIHIKKEERRILDRVDGWVKPGTLTALMVSKALLYGDSMSHALPSAA